MRPYNKVSHFFILAGFRLITFLPLWALFVIADFLAFMVYHIIGYRKKVVFQNLSKAFPEKNTQQIEHISRKFYQHLAIMIMENIYLMFIPKRQMKKRLVYEDSQIFDKLYQDKKNVVVMFGHFGNWEFSPILSQFTNFKWAAVYKKLSSPVFDKIYFDIRTRLGVQPIEMKESFRAVYNLNQKEEPFALIMAADQAPPHGETYHWMDFMNQDTGVFGGSEKLAKKFDMAVVYVELLRVKKGVYKIIPTLITDNAAKTEKFEIIEKYFHLLEESIKRYPHYWVWSHRRWKNKRKTISIK